MGFLAIMAVGLAAIAIVILGVYVFMWILSLLMTFAAVAGAGLIAFFTGRWLIKVLTSEPEDFQKKPVETPTDHKTH